MDSDPALGISVICRSGGPIHELPNRRVKHREDYRPFAPACWLNTPTKVEIGRIWQVTNTCCFACPQRRNGAIVSGRAPCDGTARVQIVPRAPIRFKNLISRF